VLHSTCDRDENTRHGVWVVTPCIDVVNINVSEDHAASVLIIVNHIT